MFGIDAEGKPLEQIAAPQVSRGPTSGVIREFTVNVVVYGDFNCLL